MLSRKQVHKVRIVTDSSTFQSRLMYNNARSRSDALRRHVGDSSSPKQFAERMRCLLGTEGDLISTRLSVSLRCSTR